MSDNNGIKRNNSGKFAAGTAKPSNSGRGRKKTPPDVKAAFEELSITAVEVLKSILNDDTAKPSDRLRAAETVLDRHLGKARQAVDIQADVNNNPPVMIYEGSLGDGLKALNDDELDTFDKLLSKAMGADVGAVVMLPEKERLE